MLTSHAALRQCVKAISPRAVPTPNTRYFLPPSAPCLVQQRTRTWLSRLLWPGFNSARKRRVRASSKTVKKKPASTSKATSPTTATRRSTPQAHDDSSSEQQGASERNPIPVEVPPRSTPQASQHHNDLSSFRRYSNKTGANKESATYIGTEYEYTVAKALNSWYGMVLQRCGGPNDEGIDLVGSWKPPGHSRDFKVLVQCKYGRPTSAFARELEGACSGGRLEWRGDGVLAVLASPREHTPTMWQTMQRSPRPMCFARVSAMSEKERRVRVIDFLPNEAANRAGLDKLKKHTVYVSSKGRDGETERPKRGSALSAKGRKRTTWFKLPEDVCWLRASIAILSLAFLVVNCTYDLRNPGSARLAQEEKGRKVNEDYGGYFWATKK